MRFALFIAVATFVGIAFTRAPKRLPVTPITVVLMLFVLWMNVSTAFAIDPAASMKKWEQVMKIMLMVYIALYLLHTRQHINVLMWILAGSVAYFGIKGGLFTLRMGGEHRVFGPPNTFIADNNAMALAIIMTVPLLRYLHLQTKERWLRWGLVAGMFLCGVSALGSHSRGGFLAVTAMLAFLWLKGRNKGVSGLLLILLIPFAILSMPEAWMERMRSIQNYEVDRSAMGRLQTWGMALNLAKDRPIVGGGFDIYTPKVFERYAPGVIPRAAHSIYFQVLGEHGYVGLFLFLLLWLLVWRDASWIIRHARSREGLQWAADLAAMIQVSLVGYAVGGAFLNLAYYDVPYNLLVAIVLTRVLIAKAMLEADSKEASSATKPWPSSHDSTGPGVPALPRVTQ
jgi:probable O-glycosylation ligase (exosortase A-associated)